MTQPWYTRHSPLYEVLAVLLVILFVLAAL